MSAYFDWQVFERSWHVYSFALLWLALFVGVREQRSTLVGSGVVFALARLLQNLALRQGFSSLLAPQLNTTADYLHATGVFLEGSALASLLGVLVFRVFLPLLGRQVPRILQDTAVLLAQAAWLVAVLHYYQANLSTLALTSTALSVILGLALKDTLGNLLSGLTIQLDESINVGAWVDLDEVSGRIVDIGWRHIAIETRDWVTVLIPNSLFANAKIHLTGVRRGEPLQVRRHLEFRVDYRHSPARVTEVVQADLRVSVLPGVAATPAPECLLLGYADSYAIYKVLYFLTNLESPTSVDSTVHKHVFTSLQRAGMSMSIPARAILVTQDTPERKERKARDAHADRLQALRSVRLFAQLPETELETLADALVFAPYSQGDTLVRQGEQPHWLYLLLEGEVERIVADDAGNNIKVANLGPGETFGEWSLTTGEVRETTVRALTEVVAYRLPREAFLAALTRHQELASQIAQLIAQRRTLLEEAMSHLTEESAQRRANENMTTVLEGLRRLFGV